MNLLDQTKKICRIYDIKPARSRGQNFLVNEEVYNKIIEAADLNKDDIVLEVGPGLGFLTEKLAKVAKKVIAVELDKKLAEVLKIRMNAQKAGNVEVINDNILDLDFKKNNIPHPTPPLIRGGNERERFKNQDSNKTISPPTLQKEELNKSPLFRRGLRGGYNKIVANLPYNITSIFLRKFLNPSPGISASKGLKAFSPLEAEKLESMTLMLQKEVAQRICANKGDLSLLGISVQFYAEPKIIQYVPKSDFWPSPEVDSAIIELRIKNEELRIKNKKEIFNSSPLRRGRLGGGETEFFRLVKIGFAQKRKMLKNNLANGFHISTQEAENWLISAGFQPMIRAQELSVEDWICLWDKWDM